MQIDPYEVLGVPPDATETAIRKAYRKKAKKAHPDQGGSPEAWEAVSTALTVLTDPDLRRGYDETGKIGEKPVDNDRASALQVIDQLLAGIVNAYIMEPDPRQDPRQRNVVAELKMKIESEIMTASAAIGQGQGVVTFFEDMRDRFTVEGVPADQNTIARNLDTQARNARDQIKQLEKNIAVRKIALEILERYRFRSDQMSFAEAYYAAQPTSYTWSNQ